MQTPRPAEAGYSYAGDRTSREELVKQRTRLMVVIAAIAAMAGVGNLTFVLNRLPDIHWSSLFAGIIGAVVAIVLAVVVRKESKASGGATSPWR